MTSEKIRERVLQDIGEASMCWEKVDQAGVFDATRASEIGNKLCEFIMEQMKEKINE